MRTTHKFVFSFQIAHRSFRYLTTSLRYLTALHLEQHPPNQVHFLSPSSPAHSWLRLFQSSPLQWMEAPSFMQVRNIGLILDTSLSLCISKSCRSGISGHYPTCLNITITTLVHPPLSCIWNPLFTFCFFFYFTFFTPLKGIFSEGKVDISFPYIYPLHSKARIWRFRF